MALAPLPYQLEGIDFLKARMHALLAWDMRLGKSMATILAAQQLGINRVLVIAPAVARPNWADEFAKWGWPHPVVQLTSARQPVAGFDGPVAMIASYEVATTEPMLSALRSRTWGLLVADECHYLKSRAANRTYATYGPEGLARSAARMWSLSGTPALKHIAELWPLMRCYGVTDLAAFDLGRMMNCRLQSGLPCGEHAGQAREVEGLSPGMLMRLRMVWDISSLQTQTEARELSALKPNSRIT